MDGVGRAVDGGLMGLEGMAWDGIVGIGCGRDEWIEWIEWYTAEYQLVI